MYKKKCFKCEKEFPITEIYKYEQHKCVTLLNMKKYEDIEIKYPEVNDKNITVIALPKTCYYYELSTVFISKPEKSNTVKSIFKNTNIALKYFIYKDNFIKNYNNFLRINFFIKKRIQSFQIPKKRINNNKIYFTPTPPNSPPPDVVSIKSKNIKKSEKPEKSEKTEKSENIGDKFRMMVKREKVENPERCLQLVTTKLRDILQYLFNLNNSKDYHNYISNKRITIVGPSASIKGTEQGKLINSYDLVIRLNKALPLPKNMYNDVGSRTDILYNNMNQSDYPGENVLDPVMFKRNGVKYVCSPYPPVHPFESDIISYIKMNKNQIPFHFVNYNTYKNTMTLLNGSRPYTGLSAIIDVLSSDIKELYITGMDFYMTKYYKGYRDISNEKLIYTRDNTIHKCLPQIKYLRYLVLTDRRIRVDKILEYVLFYSYNKIMTMLDINNAEYFYDNHPRSILLRNNNDKVYLIKNNLIHSNTLHICLGDINIEPVAYVKIHKHTHYSNGRPFVINLTKLDKNSENETTPTKNYYKKFVELASKINIRNVSYEMFIICYLIINYKKKQINIINIDREFFTDVNEQYLFMYMKRKGYIKVYKQNTIDTNKSKISTNFSDSQILSAT